MFVNFVIIISFFEILSQILRFDYWIQYWFKALLQQCRSEPVCYGDLVNKFKPKIVGKPNFSDQFNKIIKRYKKVGYNIDTT